MQFQVVTSYVQIMTIKTQDRKKEPEKLRQHASPSAHVHKTNIISCDKSIGQWVHIK
jgi:hypothetical protein